MHYLHPAFFVIIWKCLDIKYQFVLCQEGSSRLSSTGSAI